MLYPNTVSQGDILCKILWLGGPLGKIIIKLVKKVSVKTKHVQGERKTEKNYINNREEGLKNASFRLKTQKIFARGLP